MRRTLLCLAICASAIAAAACGDGTKSDAPTPTAQRTVTDPSSAGSNIGPDGTLLVTPQPQAALEAALEAISGFEITSVTFRGDDVTVKYEQVVNEPSELLLLRWLDFATIASTFLGEPLGEIVLVPVVEGAEIASVTLRAVDVVDYVDGKRSLEDVLASMVIE
jgi:hypothetical protein